MSSQYFEIDHDRLLPSLSMLVIRYIKYAFESVIK